jgi:hypothetical protein
MTVIVSDPENPSEIRVLLIEYKVFFDLSKFSNDNNRLNRVYPQRTFRPLFTIDK